MNRSHFVALLLASLVAVSCATSSEQAPPPGEQHEPEDTSPLVTPTEVPWKDMTKHHRGRYMAKVITPKMREIFQAYDPKEFAKVGCGTCHGKNAKQKEFKMPNPDLPPLPASEEEFMATTMKDKPEWVKFMSEKVTPEMAQLLGKKHFDPHAPDPEAFGCEGCHTLKGAPKTGG